MLTAGDIQFEPERSKLRQLTGSIVAMTAGDSDIQDEILQNVYRDIQARITAEPTNWWKVEDVAELHRKYYNKALLTRAENAYLSPLGLTYDTFITRQNELDSALIRDISKELLNYPALGVSTIFAGKDEYGAHIYEADNGDIRCHNSVGFAAIGAGSWHAMSQMMFAGHTRYKPLPETLLLTYAAKRHAEVAPGVGTGTDMVYHGARLGSILIVGDHVLKKLDDIYKTSRKQIRAASTRAEKRIKSYVEELGKTAANQNQEGAPAGEDGPPPPKNTETG
ncbi:MAG: hypothetical protein AABZ08_11715 [Planctomycetota bacterium]